MISDITQFFKTLNKKLGAIILSVVRNKAWVVFVTAMISLPCAAEKPTVNGVEKTAKLNSGSAVDGKCFIQGSVQRMTVKPGENIGVNGGAKDGCGSGKTSTSLSPE